jgi:negative regulator of genetic competence, sporulation and motility
MDTSSEEELFTADTPLGFQVQVTKAYWRYIVTEKHPVMDRRENDVEETFRNPTEVRRSRRDRSVYLFYTKRLWSM